MDASGFVLLMGGYGVVGTQVATLLAERQPQLRLLLAGRSKEAAIACAANFPNAVGIGLDLNSPDPLAFVAPPTLVVGIANDPKDALLRACLARGVPYLDITRWTSRLHDAIFAVGSATPKAPTVFASSWMAGAPGLVALHLARQTPGLTRIELDILYAVKDRAGPNSVEYADQLGQSFRVWENGRWTKVRALSGQQKVAFSRGNFTARRFATPDLEILQQLTAAHSIKVRVAYDDEAASSLMALLVGSGIWRFLGGTRFEAVRRSLLYNPGLGAAHEVRVTVDGSQRRTCVLYDPLGQTHMTAVATVVQIERLLDPLLAPAPGIHFAETHANVERAIDDMRSMGISIEWT